jgi:succinoglycan biosynthesis transport protein ExoP
MTTRPQTTPLRAPPPPAPPIGAPHPAHIAAPLAGGMSGSDVWRVIRAHSLLIIIFLALSAVGGYFLNGFLLSHFPKYEAVGLVKVDPTIVLDLVKDRTNELGETRLISELRTHVQFLQHDSLFSYVLSKEGRIRDTKWFASFKTVKDGKEVPDPRALKEDLQKYLHVNAISDSQLVRVSFEGSDPRDCKTIVEEIVNAHLAREYAKAENSFNQRTKALRDMKYGYEQQLQVVSGRVRDRQVTLTQKGMGGGGANNQASYFGSKEAELRELIATQLKLGAEASKDRHKFEFIAAQIQRGETLSEVERFIEQDPTVSGLSRELYGLEIQRDLKKATLGDQHKDILAFNQLIDITRQKLEDRRQELRLKMREQWFEMVKGEAQQSATDYEGMTKQVNDLKNELAQLSREMALFMIDQDDEKGLREVKNEVENKLRDMTLTINPSSLARIDWGAKPEIPELPNFPKLPLTMTASIILGLGLALGIAFLREFLDDTVRTPRDVARVGQMNLLGIIADEGDDPQAADAKLPIFDAPHSLTAEQFRQVRTRLSHATPLDTTRTIMITGPSPMDGKTTVAANLAAGLALNGRKILLVDANFRRPELHHLFGFANGKGFSDVLNGACPFEEAVHPTHIPNLSVMTSGPKPMNPTELFESQLLNDFIERGLEEYDHILFDSGPFLIVSEAQALAPRVDGVVTVVRAHAESRGLLLRMRDSLRQVKAEHIGVVLNAVRARGGGYYRSNIKTFYQYQNGD